MATRTPNLSHIKIERFGFTTVMGDDLALPLYSGSMLRGAFGHALRRVACMTKKKECSGCPLLQSCVYAQVFETPPPPNDGLQNFSKIPNPFIIRPPAMGKRILPAGKKMEFEMILIGKCFDHLALIIFAWQKAVEFGLGKGKIKGKLISVERIDASNSSAKVVIWTSVNPVLKIEKQNSCTHSNRAIDLQGSIQLLSPLRIQHQGKPYGVDTINPKVIFTALIRRINLISELYFSKKLDIDYPEMIVKLEKITMTGNLKWSDWTRYSNRQKQSMKLGGIIGEFQLHGEFQPFIDYLRLGELLHLGKNTSFGLGRYQLN